MIRTPMTLKLEARPYRIDPRSLGGAAPGIDLDRSLRLAEALEDDARTRKHLNPLLRPKGPKTHRRPSD